MYSSPDFIKVNLDIKDSFATYSNCVENTMANMNFGHCNVPGDPDYNFQRYTVLFSAAVHECYTDKI